MFNKYVYNNITISFSHGYCKCLVFIFSKKLLHLVGIQLKHQHFATIRKMSSCAFGLAYIQYHLSHGSLNPLDDEIHLYSSIQEANNVLKPLFCFNMLYQCLVTHYLLLSLAELLLVVHKRNCNSFKSIWEMPFLQM